MMDNFKLSNRLTFVAGLIRRGNIVADIGTDHGYLPIYIIKNNISDYVIGMDLRKGPLQKASENVKEYNVSKNVELRLSDGMDKLEKDEVQTVTICGMGGKLIQTILTNGRDKINENTQLIVSPQSEIAEFRQFLEKEGFVVDSEHMLKEDGQYYLIIECRILKNNDSDSTLTDMQKQVYYRYGESLLKAKDSCLKEYLMREQRINEGVYETVSHLERNEGVEKRLIQLEEDKKYIEYALSFYQE